MSKKSNTNTTGNFSYTYTTTTVVPTFTRPTVDFTPRFREVNHTDVPEFNWEEERDNLINHMRDKLSRPVMTSTLYDKFVEMNHTYSNGDVQFLESFKERIWSPKDINNIELTVSEIENLKPTLMVAPNSTEWNHIRRCVSTMSYSQGVGRRIKFYMIDEVSGNLLGVAEVSSDFGSLGVRDRHIGWTTEDRFTNNKLNHTCIGSTIVPVGVFGHNFLGGKLLSLLLSSNLVQQEWFNKYGDVLTAVCTTSLYGHKNGGSQYSGLRPIWKSLGHTEGRVMITPDVTVYRRCVGWLRQYFPQEYTTAMNGSRPKNAVLSLICRKLGIIQSSLFHGFERGVYLSELYTDTKEFLRGEIDEVTTKRFDDSVESLTNRWRDKAIRRYRSLIRQNRIKDSVLYYTDIVGKTYQQTLEMYFGVTITKRIAVVVVPYSELLKNNSIIPQYDCLNQSSQLSGMLSSQYHTSFMRQVV